jgi:hypothetical protein
MAQATAAHITRRQLLKSAPPAIAVAAIPAVAEAAAPLSDQEQIDGHVRAIRSILLKMYPQADTVDAGMISPETGEEMGGGVIIYAYRRYIEYCGPGAYECAYEEDGKRRRPIYWVEQTPTGYRAKLWYSVTGKTQGGWRRSFGDGLKFVRKLT